MARKRANVYRRNGDGRWVGVLNLEPTGGKRKRKIYYGDTQADVVRKLSAGTRALELGQRPNPGVETTGSFLARWLAEVAKPDVRPTSYRAYEIALRLHIIPQLGKVRLVKLGPDDLDRLYADLLAEGLSAAYVGQIHSIIHSALAHASRRDLVARNVAALTRPPRTVRTEFRTLTPEEASRFLAATEDDRLHALYVVAIHTGMRLGELCGLRWADLGEGCLSVVQQAYRLDGAWHFTAPKTKAGRRSITLSRAASEALRLHRIRQTQERLAAKSWEDHDLVFCNPRGRPVEASNLRRRSFHPALARAGLPRIRFHDLRHTAATLLLAGGVHAKVVQEMLGHSSVAITLDVYSHVTPNLQAEAAAKMDELVPAATG
ncbi:hypothetical protein LCGC14_1803780 [marine sediment metagenome]|uniref:Tyr recombinase domain-containing protein n=2 Tax=marine sediment metagenome TaxID=412755 RepID=A0A0F9J3J5_9ZZZZ